MRQAAWLWAVVAGLWLAALVYYLAQPYLHPDVSWALLAAGWVLDGAHIYRDIIEVNPPLIFYSAVPAVLAAQLTGWSPTASFVVYVLLLITLSLVLSQRILASTGNPARRQAYVIIAGLVALTLLPVTDFGEREHFTTILTLPYVLLVSARFAGRDCDAKLATIAGLAAGIGFAFKPYFLVVPAALELYLLVRTRSLGGAFRPETVTAAATIALYAAVVYLVHPEYIETIVPFGMLVYEAYAKPLVNVLRRPELPTLLAPLVVFAAARVTGWADRSLDALAIAAGGFFVAYLLQAKGWSYHLIPTATYLWLCSACVLSMLFDDRIAASARQRRLLVAVATLALAAMAVGPMLRGATRSPIADRLAPIVRELAPARSFYAFTSHVWVSFPLVPATGLDWTSRFPTHWLLPGLVNRLDAGDEHDQATRQRLLEVERYAIDAVIADFRQNRPDIVVVDLANPYFDEPFDYLAYFGRDPRFAALWRDYVRIERVEIPMWMSPAERLSGTQLRQFDVYCRRGSTPACGG